MGEHKDRDGIKGAGYKKGQRQVKRGRYVRVASPSDDWFERRFPGFKARKAEILRQKQEEAAKAEGGTHEAIDR